MLALIGQNFSVELFKGIPYAQPPVGSARWNPPMKLESFDELNKDEFQHQTFCIPSQVTDEEPIVGGFEKNTKMTFWKAPTVP